MFNKNALRLFNEKAVKLLSRSFAEQIFKEKSGVKVAWSERDGASFQHFGPSEESIEAFLLTLRFFVQDNEAMSIRNLVSTYRVLGDEDQYYWRIKDAREKLNEYLDKGSGRKVSLGCPLFRDG